MLTCLEKGVMSSTLGSGKFKGGLFVRREGPQTAVCARSLPGYCTVRRANLACVTIKANNSAPPKSQLVDEGRAKAVIR